MFRSKLEEVLVLGLAAAMILAAIGLVVNYSRSRTTGVTATAATAVDNDGCLSCHGDRDYQPKTSERPWDELYTDEAVLASSTHRSITCSSCHKTSDTGVPITPAAAQQVCGSCHQEEQRRQEESIHSDPNVTNCLSCHSKGESGHDVQPVLSPRSPAFAKNVAETCGSCHSDQALMSEYDLSADVYEVYMESPHGKVLKLTGPDNDGLNPATCTSCHGSHDVMATDAPDSPLREKESKSQVCASCHEGAGPNFGDTIAIHQAPTAGGTPAAFFGERFFFLLTAGVVTFGILILVLAGFGWFYRRSTAEARSGAVALSTPGAPGVAILGVWPGPASLAGPQAGALPRRQALAVSHSEEIERFDSHQRIQHFIMMATFLTLALTGLPQKFPDVEASRWLIDALGGLGSVRTIHRFAGLLMMTDCVYHLGYVTYNTLVLKKRPPIAMIPSPKDVLDFFQHMLYWFGRSPDKPRFGRFSYLEKFDYWAIFWGMPVIGMSGLVLMFPVLISKLLPGDAIQIAFIAHSDEAVLAVLWIFLVHFFFVHINPRFFPLNKAMFTGKMRREVYEEEHPLELEELEGRPGGS